MNFLKNLFGRTATSSSAAKGSAWYLATAHNNRVRQIVFTLSPTCVCESEFSGLELSSHYRVAEYDWKAEVVDLDTVPEPKLIIRVDNLTSKLRGYVTRVAFGFCHMKSSGLFSIHVNVDCPQATCREIGRVNIGFEILAGLDQADSVNCYGKFIQRPNTNICFMERTERRLHETMPPTSILQGKFDLVWDVPPDCLRGLEREWNGLLSYHKKLSSPDFQSAVSDAYKIIPNCSEKCPILPPA
jgi:hypothetical protein